MYIKSKSGPCTDSCGIPDIIFSTQIFHHLRQFFVLDYSRWFLSSESSSPSTP